MGNLQSSCQGNALLVRLEYIILYCSRRFRSKRLVFERYLVSTRHCHLFVPQGCGVLASLAALVSLYRRRDDAELRNATLRSLPLVFFAAHVAARGTALGGPSLRALGAAAIAAAAIGDALSLRPHTPAFLSGLILKHLVSPALLIALACVQGGRIPTAPLLVVFAAFAWYVLALLATLFQVPDLKN